MLAGQPGEDAVVGAGDGGVQLLHADVQCRRAVDDVSVVLGHLGAAGLAAVVRAETVALEEVPKRDVIAAVVEHLDDTVCVCELGGGGEEEGGRGRFLGGCSTNLYVMYNYTCM